MYAPTRRVESLDAFRGVAAVLVMLAHYMLYVPNIFDVVNIGVVMNLVKWILPYFFILSGYVLTLSYQRLKERDKHPYFTAIKSRFFRLYPLYFVATIAMFIIREVFGAGESLDGASLYFNIPWRLEGSLLDLLHSLSLVGVANTWTFNGPAWTLVYEMRYIFILPLLISMLRWRWWLVVIFILLADVATRVASGLEVVDVFYTVDYVTSNLCSMFVFLLSFVSGVLLALYRDKIFRHYQLLTNRGKWGYVVVSILFALNCLYTHSLLDANLANTIVIIGTTMWIVVLINNITIARFFSTPLMMLLGRCSFSVYLWHTPVIVTLYMLLHESISIWLIIAIAAVVTLFVAQLSFKYIESPFIALSRNKK